MPKRATRTQNGAPAEKTQAVFHVHPVVCMAVIALAIGLLLHESIIGGKGLVPTDGLANFLPWAKTSALTPSNSLLADQYLQFVPGREFYHRELHNGRFPLWNPHLAGGVPSVASMQGAALYPINFVLSPLSPFVASGIAALVKLVLAGLFTLLYLRRVGAANTAALVGGLTFSLSGFLIVWLGHPHTNSAVLLPALFYFVEGIATQPRKFGQWMGLALTTAVSFLGGHMPTVVHMTLATAAYAAFRLFTAPVTSRRRFAFYLIAAGVTGALLAAPQLFPFVEYQQLSSVRDSSEALKRWASHLNPATLLHFLMPYLTGSPTLGFEHLAVTLGLAPIENFNERTGYVGLLALFLAMVALFRRRCSFTFFFGGLTIVALTIVYGMWPWSAVMRSLPVLANINHERLLLWVGWGVAVLAGLGTDTLLRAQPRRRPKGLAIGFVTGVVLVLFALWNTVGGISRLDVASRSFVLNQIWIVAFGLAAALVVTLRWLGPRWVPAICVGWTAIDLLSFAIGYNPAVPREAYKPTTGAIRFLQADRTRFRVFGLGTTLAPNTAGTYGLDDIRGQDFMTVARYEEFITGRKGEFFFYMSAASMPPPLALRNVKYVLVPQKLPADPPGLELAYADEIAIYRNLKFGERALIVFDHRVEPRPALVLAAVRDPEFNPEQTLWLEEAPNDLAAESGQSSGGGAGAGELRFTAYEPDRVVIDARLPKPGFVLLLDTWFPGWAATVDGHDARVLRADYVYRAVRVPAGAHTITFTYQPASFRVGVALSLGTLGLLAALWWRSRRRDE